MVKYPHSESFIHFTYFEAIFLVKNKRKAGMGGLSPPAKNRNRNRFVFLSFGVDPLNWQSFIEIGEIACSTTARCSRGHATNLLRDSCGLCHATIGKKEIYFFKMQISPMRNIIRRRTNHNRKDLSLEYFCRQNPSWP